MDNTNHSVSSHLLFWRQHVLHVHDRDNEGEQGQWRGMGASDTCCLGTRWVRSIFLCTHIRNMINLLYFLDTYYCNNNMCRESVTGITKVNWAQMTSHRLGRCVFSFFFSTLLLIFFHSFLDILLFVLHTNREAQTTSHFGSRVFLFSLHLYPGSRPTTSVTNLFLFVLDSYCDDTAMMWHSDGMGQPYRLTMSR